MRAVREVGRELLGRPRRRPRRRRRRCRRRAAGAMPRPAHLGVGVLDADDDPARRRRRRGRRRTAGCGRGGCTARACTYTVAPRTSAPASRAAARATTSAWGPPGGWVAPSNTSPVGGDEHAADPRVGRRRACARRRPARPPGACAGRLGRGLRAHREQRRSAGHASKLEHVLVLVKDDASAADQPPSVGATPGQQVERVRDDVEHGVQASRPPPSTIPGVLRTSACPDRARPPPATGGRAGSPGASPRPGRAPRGRAPPACPRASGRGARSRCRRSSPPARRTPPSGRAAPSATASTPSAVTRRSTTVEARRRQPLGQRLARAVLAGARRPPRRTPSAPWPARSGCRHSSQGLPFAQSFDRARHPAGPGLGPLGLGDPPARTRAGG